MIFLFQKEVTEKVRSKFKNAYIWLIIDYREVGVIRWIDTHLEKPNEYHDISFSQTEISEKEGSTCKSANSII